MTYRTLWSVLCAIVILGARTAAAEVTPPEAPQPQPSTSLVLAADLDGRFIIRNAAKELIAEVHKPAGRTLSITVDPGVYEVRVERERTALVARVTIAAGTDVVLDRQQLGPPPVEVVSAPAQAEVLTYSLTSRNRFDIRFGAWSHGTDAQMIEGVDWSDAVGGIRYTRYFTERLAATFTIEGGGGQVGTFASANGVYEGVSGVVSFPVGVRWNPLKYGRQDDGIKPYLAFSAGPVFGNSVADHYRGGRYDLGEVQSTATIGGFVGGGVDFHAGRTFVIGVDAGYNWMGDFAVPIGGSDNHSGPAVSISLGLMWGRGSTPRQ